MNRKGPWEGYTRQAKRRLARCLLPAFLCRTFSSRERRLGTWQGFDCISFQSVEYFKPSLHSNRLCWSLAETLATQTILSDAFSKENFQKYATASSV